jgi:thiol-disulfide isomerase/thioredoxin
MRHFHSVQHNDVDGECRKRATAPGKQTRTVPTQTDSQPANAKRFAKQSCRGQFFASWCPPCRTEFENLNTLKAEFATAIEIVAVNIFEAWDENDDERLTGF